MVAIFAGKKNAAAVGVFKMMAERVVQVRGASAGPVLNLGPFGALLRTRLAYYLVSRSGAVKLAIVVASDLMVIALSMLFSLALTRRVFTLSVSDFMLIFSAPLLTVICLGAAGGYRVVVRFVGMELIERCVLAMAVSALLLHPLQQLFPSLASWRVLITFAFVGFFSLLALRRVASRFLRPFLKRSDVTNVIIYGAGDAGAQLAASLFMNTHIQPVGFIDDRKDLQGRTIRGLRVYSKAHIAALKAQRKFDQVLLAIPSATRARRRRLLEELEPLAVKVMVMPGMEDIVSGRKRIDELRDVQVEDILDRDPVAPIDALLDECIREKSVMVTGAGGSIGAELCRQIIKRGVSRLVLFESSEYALYTIEQELRLQAIEQPPEIVAVLANVLDRDTVARTLNQHGVETIYHAAAYKHVPLVESNIISALKNNVIGTLNVVEEAVHNNVKNFVLISTDKAVRPPNVMGATKRICELIVQAMAQRHPQMRMAMVRFGNVLASSGSVVPLFKKQIRSGGPVTVTHPDVTRYFMTIPEAALLVIQAGSMGAHGEVFVLDMGQPVKILDLARRIIHLSGLEIREVGSETGDIEIQFSGLRPGEKLFEELLISDNPEGTRHPRIFKAQERFLDWDALSKHLEAIAHACANQSEAHAKKILAELVSGYGLRADQPIQMDHDDTDLMMASNG